MFQDGEKVGEYPVEVGGERWDSEHLEKEGVCLMGHR